MEKAKIIKKWKPIIENVFSDVKNDFLINFMCVYSQEYQLKEDENIYLDTSATLHNPVENNKSWGSVEPVSKLPHKLKEINNKLNNIEKIKIDPNSIFYDPIKDKLDFNFKSDIINHDYYESVEFISEIFGDIGILALKKHYKTKYRSYKLKSILS